MVHGEGCLSLSFLLWDTVSNCVGVKRKDLEPFEMLQENN